MANFDFITNRELRECLRSDYAELQLTLDAAAHKAALVLAGSIVEAMLVDYVMAYGKKGPSYEEMGLAKLIDVCHPDVLSDKDKNLCSAVKDYRNLIHPGRLTRQNESVNGNDAQVAAGVVEIVAADVAKAFGKKRGLTCEQLLTKTESDPDAVSIMPHLVDMLRASELTRLMLEALPNRCEETLANEPDETRAKVLMRGYRACHQAAFRKAPKTLKSKSAQQIVRVIREGDADAVVRCDEVFLTAQLLTHLKANQQMTLKAHLLAKMNDLSGIMPVVIKGIGPLLNRAEAKQFASILTIEYLQGRSSYQSEHLLASEYSMMKPVAQQAVLAYLDLAFEHYTKKERWDRTDQIGSLRRTIEPKWVNPYDIPF